MQMMVSFSPWPLKTADKKTGRIVTGYGSNSTVEAAIMGNMRSSGSFQLYPEGKDSTYVLALIRTESTNAFGSSSPQTMLKSQAKEEYEKVFQLIDRVLYVHRHGSLRDSLQSNN
jgi:hypothetical protein